MPFQGDALKVHQGPLLGLSGANTLHAIAGQLRTMHALNTLADQGHLHAASPAEWKNKKKRPLASFSKSFLGHPVGPPAGRGGVRLIVLR